MLTRDLNLCSQLDDISRLCGYCSRSSFEAYFGHSLVMESINFETSQYPFYCRRGLEGNVHPQAIS